MYELCEFFKGEGFSEGFDVYFNIEQMNKIFVELFQLYDDYRKRGIIIFIEKEFRGYYVFFKLDKYFGYKVSYEIMQCIFVCKMVFLLIYFN